MRVRPFWIALVALLPSVDAGFAEEAPEPAASLATALIPGDVIAAVRAAAPGEVSKLCPARGHSVRNIEGLEPIVRIAGLNSRMDNADTVAGYRSAERFSSMFGAIAVGALANDDEDVKRQLIAVLAKWAGAGAFLKSESCVNGGQLSSKEACREWRRPDGKDLSAMKDATFSTFIAFGLIRAYYIALADAALDMTVDHAAIRGWIDKIALRLKRPGDVYFGLNMGWYWPSVTIDLAAGRTRQAEQKLKAVEKGLIRLVKDDGSITDRTTRGDRALWYHHTSTDEIVLSMELMRAAGMPVSPKLEKKLHAAAALFVAAVKDQKVIDKWARQRHNATYNGYQSWDLHGWPSTNFAGTWLHVYPYRYPDEPAAKELRALVPVGSASATEDIDFGLGIGCLYNAAATVPR